MSLLGALTPLGKVAGMKRKWLINVTAYTVAGATTSALTGAALGLLGAVLLGERILAAGTAVAITVGVLAIARELGIAALPLPQVARQTKDVWVKRSDPTVAAIRWGLDLGLVFTTWFTFPGIWLITVVAFVVGEPAFGAALFAAYWLGRALSVWIGPLLMRDARETPQLLSVVRANYPIFRRAHIMGLALAVAVLAMSIANVRSL